jgi:CBS domain-containing protein
VPTVGELMHRGLVTCRPEASLAEAASSLLEHRVHALVVVDGSGAPAGLLSDTDLLAGEWIAGDAERLEAMKRLTAADLMTSPVATIDAQADTAEAAARLTREHLGRLVVVQRGEAVGVVAVSDLVAALRPAAAGRDSVAEVMSRGFLACREETTVAAVARAMTDRRSRSAVVLAADGRVAGVVTGHDLLAAFDGAAERSVRDLMHAPLTVSAEATLQQATDLLLRHEVHRLVVVDPDDPGGVPLGIVSTTDVLAEMAAPGSAWHPSS